MVTHEELPDRIAIPWYEPAGFELIRGMSTDHHRMPADYAEWRLRVDRLEARLREMGEPFYRAPMRPPEFFAWCRERGVAVNESSRIDYASWLSLRSEC